MSSTVIGTVESSDADQNDTHSYSIGGGNDEAIFAIDANTGELSVASNTQFDFESKSSYSLNVNVSDGLSTTETPVPRVPAPLCKASAAP